jgi:nucleotide-binding universal stress UspA family protein
LWLRRDAQAGEEKAGAVPNPDPEGVAAAELVKQGAGPSGDAGDKPPSPPEVIIRSGAEPMPQAVADEAKKGYDLMLVGLARPRTKSGAFHSELAGIVQEFDGPLLLVAGSERQLAEPARCPASILVPVTGSDVSRRAAEVAIAIGGACGARITVLYVSGRRSDGLRRGNARTRRHERAILDDIVGIAERCGASVSTEVRTDLAADAAILAETKEGAHDLLIMGVNRRPGEQLFFGETAAAVFAQTPSSIALLAS